MPPESKHLQKIITHHNQTATVQVVFCDIEKYSKRIRANQIAVISKLTAALKQDIEELKMIYAAYINTNDLNFDLDLIVIPTGDGVLAAFSFEGLHDIHLVFAKSLLAKLNPLEEKEPCPEFDQNGWCNCHDYINLRIGISEGKAIIYKDINERFNVAGGTVNLASRAMGLAQRNHIICTEYAYREIIENDIRMKSSFVEMPDQIIKHGETITVYRLETWPHYVYKRDTIIKRFVDANIDVIGDLKIEESAIIRGNVTANNIVLCGQVIGNVMAHNRLAIRSTGKLYGNADCSRLTLEEGCVLTGKSSVAPHQDPPNRNE